MSSYRKWDRTGKIVEVKNFDQYLVKVDGSGWFSLRNPKFLRKFTPYRPAGASTRTAGRYPGLPRTGGPCFPHEGRGATVEGGDTSP